MLVPPAVSSYIEAIPPEHRALFDRVWRALREARPDAEIVLSYRMPTLQLGRRRLHLGVWAHGVSLYGWRDRGFLARHPHTWTSRGTIRLRSADAADVTDDELRDLARASLAPP